jgi:hypothetical protein
MQQPRPFVWTKTADQILDTIATYCQRINDSDTGARTPLGQTFRLEIRLANGSLEQRESRDPSALRGLGR